VTFNSNEATSKLVKFEVNWGTEEPLKLSQTTVTMLIGVYDDTRVTKRKCVT